MPSSLDTIDPLSLAYLRTSGSLAVLAIPLIFALPPLRPARRSLRSLVSDFITYDSLLSPEAPTKGQKQEVQRRQLQLWRQIVLAGLGMVEMGAWTAVTGMHLLRATEHQLRVVDVLLSAGMVVVWVFLFLLPLFRPPTSPPWAATIVYVLLWTISLVYVGMFLYVRASDGYFPEWATLPRRLAEGANIIATTCLLFTVGGLNLVSPEALARLEVVTPDDLVTLFSWASFSWMNSFISFGNAQELKPEDVPKLSMTQQCAIVFERFRQMPVRSLLYKIALANKLDLFLDALLTLVSVIFNYASPFYLKKILDGLAIGTPEAMSQAYIYAFLALLASIMKGVSDLFHLWHARRAVVRIKAELIAAIYDKALRRKDASGVLAVKEEDGKEGEKKGKTSNADTGKVVNLMSGDTQRISNTAAGIYYLYGSPLEILVASAFLYNILGWSAFAGIVVLVIAMPLNSFVSKRSVKITQGLLKARDKRIGVMNELVGAIQFIKFFAWVEQWKGRAADARAKEMKQLVKSMINSLYFSMLWSLAPILVTLVSFFCFIVIEKRELTVSIAFTAVSLFAMLRMPLNVIPTFVVMLLQAHVCVKRIEDFLNEDEVPDWVSSLKATSDGRSLLPAKIGFEKATLQWNTGKQSDVKAVEDAKTTPTRSASAINSTAANEPEDIPRFSLIDLDVVFPIGRLSLITGPTGSGKSAILTALLGEMELLSGKTWLPKNPAQLDAKTKLRNSIAYAAQTPWLQQKSIKDNILFGEEYDEARYEATLEACALVPDLDVLEDGDMTEIGQKGVSLSGGQKARVALGRAVYSYTQHLLLDDPLAAVDSHTAKHLTDHCLNGPLLRGRTVILVSHHIELLLSSVNYVVRIVDGRIDAQGTPDKLRAEGQLEGLVAIEEAQVTQTEPISVKEEVDEEAKAVENGGENSGSDHGGGQNGAEKSKKKGPGKKFVQDEERQVGNVKWATYKLYIEAATYTTWVCTFLILIISQVFGVGERWWLKIWGEAYTISYKPVLAYTVPAVWDHTQNYYHNDLYQHVLHPGAPYPSPNSTTISPTAILPQWPSADARPGFYLTGYAAIVLGSALLGIATSAVGAWTQYRAAINLHDRLLDRMLRGTVRFFNVTPLGRILNRFSRDIETIDTSLNQGLRTIIVYVASLFSAIAVVAVIVPWFLIPAAAISYLYYAYSILYLKVGRSLRRLEATNRSPIFSGFSELLDGVVSVRAFCAEARFMKGLCQQVDNSHAAFYYYWMMNRWLLVRFDILGAFGVFLTSLFALSGAVPAGSAGMAILSAQSFVTGCYWVSRFWGQLEMDFNSVERVEEYLQIPQEPPSTIKGHQPPAYWPSSDRRPDFLSVRELEIKYAPDLPTVFKGSFDVKSGEKIGLIGRTGSGKSTLAMSLLRFSEPTSGSIWLDGLDITSVGVDDLRSRITYIPQDAVLFSGTVRDNLDPFDEHTEEELLDALSRVNLGPKDSPLVSRAPSRAPSSKRLAALAEEDSRPSSPVESNTRKNVITLTTEVSSGGSNFSQGQRQLVAMARALLRRSNLIIMDEATASVDFATDAAIQAAIRIEFKSSTLLTIAHRLSSVIDYDRLLVLSDGRVAEFDTPINLLRKDGSLFKSLCEKSGRYRDLFNAAEKKEKDSTPAA